MKKALPHNNIAGGKFTGKNLDENQKLILKQTKGKLHALYQDV